MRCLISTSTNPHFNLAAEEYFLKNSNEEFFMLYINEPCIVVGKHQNLLSEINHKFVIENKILLARRISGGGTVYQDSNNLNFSFIHNCENREKINFQKFTAPILEVLTKMGFPAGFSNRNDLIINNKKFSGNAMHIYKNRVLSHGTLLFNTDISRLSQSLYNRDNRYNDRSIKSVRSEVTNLSNFLPVESEPNITEFTNKVFERIVNSLTNYTIKKITKEEKELITNLSDQKFKTWDWVYGYSPKYIFTNQLHIDNLKLSIQLSVDKGIIQNILVDSNANLEQINRELTKILVNTRHDLEIIKEKVAENNILNSHITTTITEFCMQLF